MVQFLSSEGLDSYEIHQLLAYILETSTESTFLSLELKKLLIKDETPKGSITISITDKYEKKESILTKSSENRDDNSPGRTSRGEEISFFDCEIEVLEKHSEHNCGLYD